MSKTSPATPKDPDQTARNRRGESRETGAPDPSRGAGPAPVYDEHPLHRIAVAQEALIKVHAGVEAALQEAGQKAKKERKGLLMELLEVMDAFDRLFRNLEERAATLEAQTKQVGGNFRTVRRLLSLALERTGVTAMEAALGSPVDPRRHEVVETRPTPGEPDNLILEVIQAGYFWNGEILRYARVAAGKNTEEVQHGQGHRD